MVAFWCGIDHAPRAGSSDTGVVFIRTDIADRDEASIPALFGSVCDVTLSTKIGNSHGHVVGTIEHLLAALAGMQVDNVIVEIDGPEVPIMDGSAQPFVDLMRSVGTVELTLFVVPCVSKSRYGYRKATVIANCCRKMAVFLKRD